MKSIVMGALTPAEKKIDKDDTTLSYIHNSQFTRKLLLQENPAAQKRERFATTFQNGEWRWQNKSSQYQRTCEN